MASPPAGSARPLAPRTAPLLACLLGLSSLLPSCTSVGQSLLKLMPGVVNDPQNRTMRREIMSFGSKEFCKELSKRGAPLKMRDDMPAMGRFFADQCDYRELDSGDVFVQFAGFGYAWTQPSKRVGFRASGAIQYNPDFILDGSTMYAYFRPRNVQSTQFTSVMIEGLDKNPLGGLFGANAQETANRMGNQIVAQEMQRGFTVLRDDNGSVDFGVGVIEKGKRPFHPYQVHGSDKALLASDWSEIHEQQREFLGPFEVDGDDRALFLTVNLDGVPGVDLFLMPADAGSMWLREYVNSSGVGALRVSPMLTEVIPAGKPWTRTIAARKGLYFLVIDHSSAAGSVAPPPGQGGLLSASDLAAVVRYVVQVGDAP